MFTASSILIHSESKPQSFPPLVAPIARQLRMSTSLVLSTTRAAALVLQGSLLLWGLRLCWRRLSQRLAKTSTQRAGGRLPIGSCSEERQRRLLKALGASAGLAAVRSVPRYLRLRKTLTKGEVDESLDTLGYPPSAPTPLADFVALECDVPVTTLACHRPRLALGLDLASGVVVRELLRGASVGAHVLDICCAPGGKLLYAAERCGSVTGVDVSSTRLDQCRALVRRLGLPNVRLACVDATKWLPLPPRGQWEGAAGGGVHPTCWKGRQREHSERSAERAAARGDPEKEQRLSKSGIEWAAALPSRSDRCDATAAGGTRAASGVEAAAAADASIGWERVVVDAECTADAALPHMRRMLALQAERGDEELLAFDRFAKAGARAEGLPDLQRRLLLAAFASLRVGGVLLYVTCSASPAQGEAVVESLLATRSDALLERVETHGVRARRVGPDGLQVRFTPEDSNTSGLFCARVVRVSPRCAVGGA